MEFAVFMTKTKIDSKANEQPTTKVYPIPYTQLGHHIQTTNQAQ
jgi:hypothetical protein